VENRLIVAIGTVASIGILLAALVVSAHAEEAAPSAAAKKKAAAAAAVAADAQKKIDELSRQVEEMRRMMESAQREIKSLNQKVEATQAATALVATEAAVAGGEAGAAGAVAGGTAVEAGTIGQTVGLLQKDLQQVREDLSKNLGIQVHGLVDATYEYNLNQPSQRSNLGGTNQFRAFDTDANSFELSQFNLRVQRRVEGGVGFLVDLNFGKVAEVLRTATRYTSNPAGVGIGEVDPTQAFITYTVPVGNGLDVMAGKFVTLIGAEVIKTYDALNYNESNGLLFTWAIPFTHTGIRARYAFNEMLSVTGGVNNGWDDVSDNNSGKSIEGQFAITPIPEVSILINGIVGAEQFASGGSVRGLVDPIVTWKTPLEGLTLIGEYVYGAEDQPIGVAPFLTGPNVPINPLVFLGGGPLTRDADWMAFAGYVVYDFNDKLQTAVRGEWFRDSQGVRTGIRQTLWEMTLTLNYKITDYLLLRAEYRHDESNTRPFYTNNLATPIMIGGAPATANVRTRSGQDTLMSALIYTF
jgi:hypothetical protein